MNYYYLLPDLHVINNQWLELPIFWTVFHGPKDVRAIEVRLYFSFWKYYHKWEQRGPIIQQTHFRFEQNKTVLNLNALITTTTDDTLKYLFLFFREYKVWHFIWVFCESTVLTLKQYIINTADDILKYLFLCISEDKAWHFILVDDSHEMPSFFVCFFFFFFLNTIKIIFKMPSATNLLSTLRVK